MIAQALRYMLTCFAVVTLLPVKAAVQFFASLRSDTLRPTIDLVILLHLALVRGLCGWGHSRRDRLVLVLWLLRRPIWKRSLVFA